MKGEVKRVGGFTLTHLGDKLWISTYGEGGGFSLPTFEAEVCAWGELGEDKAERVAEYYRRWF